MRKPKLKRLPLKCYLYRCTCGCDPKNLGYIYETLKEAESNACMSAVIQKVVISPLKNLIK